MIPPTKNRLPAMACLSALQKCIRRNLELDAMRFAVELHQTSKNFATMVCNRLEIVSHEDIDTMAAPWIVPYVKTACVQARAWYDPAKLGKSRMAIGNCIRLMCRAPKSRQGDHFHVAVGLAALLEGYVPEIPDWADDQHTLRGKRLGRGLDYFRQESTKLVPPAHTDPYESEAFRLWRLREAREARQLSDEQLSIALDHPHSADDA
jgi:replication-associated recombination protein RarA